MAYITEYLQLLSSVQKRLKESGDKAYVAALSHAEVLATKEELEKYGIAIKSEFVLSTQQSMHLCNYHRLKYDSGASYVDVKGLWDSFDWNVHTYDVKPLNGYEKVLDLGNNLPKELYHKYDAVVDNGVYEHIFNIGLAIVNSILMLKNNGYITFYGPLNQPNHGFWNASPTVFVDIFRHYGFENLFFQGVRMNLDPEGHLSSASYFPLQDTIGGQVLEGECNYIVVAKASADHIDRCAKLKELDKLYPVQSKYLSILS